MTPQEKNKLAAEFQQVILDDYREFRKGRRDRAGVRYRGMITIHGAVKMMKLLLDSPTNNRKPEQFGAEQFVILKKFRPLFKAEEIQKAKTRLKRT